LAIVRHSPANFLNSSEGFIESSSLCRILVLSNAFISAGRLNGGDDCTDLNRRLDAVVNGPAFIWRWGEGPRSFVLQRGRRLLTHSGLRRGRQARGDGVPPTSPVRLPFRAGRPLCYKFRYGIFGPRRRRNGRRAPASPRRQRRPCIERDANRSLR
jgi:hypothetical protein